MKRFFRLLLGHLCRVAAALAFFAAVIASFVCIAMVVILKQDGRWTGGEFRVFLGALAAMLLGGFAAWLLQGLSHRILGEKKGAVRSFTLVRSKSGRQERFAAWFGVTFWLVAGCGWIWRHSPADDPWTQARQAAMAMGVFFLGWHLRILLHELGHLGAAWAMGLDLMKLHVGVGPLLWRRQRKPGGLEWEWRLWPGGGFMKALHHRASGFRWRQMVFVGGGPAVDACLIWAGVAWIRDHYGSLEAVYASGARSGAAAGALLVITSLSAFNGILPHKVWQGNRQFYTDGWWLWRLFRLSPKEAANYLFHFRLMKLDALYAVGQQSESVWEYFRDIRASHPDQTDTLAYVEGNMRRQEKDFTGAVACYERALALETLPPDRQLMLRVELAVTFIAADEPERARQSCAAALEAVLPENRVNMLDAFACLPIMRGAKALLPDAERWIEEAITLAPDRLSLRGTRASLLVEQDCLYEAEAPLREIYDKSAEAADRGISAFYLALIIRRRNGPAREWKRWRRRAIRLCPQPWLLERARTELVDLPATVAATAG